MAAAFIEHRPLAQIRTAYTHHAVVVGGPRFILLNSARRG